MTDESDELLKLTREVRELSDYIAMLKRKKNTMPEGPEKEQLAEDIKIRQFQALFYLEKMENLAKQ